MTQTQPFTSTFLQKLLGRNYKWWYLINYWIRSNIVYFWSEVFVSMNRAVTLLGAVIIFLYFGQGNESILNYLLLGNLFFAVTDPVLSWFVSDNIKNGGLTRWLMYPIKYTTFLFFAAIANGLYMSLTYLAALIPVIFIFRDNISLTGNFGLILLFLPMSFFIRFTIQILAGFSSFWFVEGAGVNHLTQSFESFLSGSVFPLYILPATFSFVIFVPFSFTFYHPMQIYLGKYSPLETLYVFLGGIAWCVVLYFLAKWVFRMGLKRNESVGL